MPGPAGKRGLPGPVGLDGSQGNRLQMHLAEVDDSYILKLCNDVL